MLKIVDVSDGLLGIAVEEYRFGKCENVVCRHCISPDYHANL
jgi:hypothetical protein